MLNNSLVGCSFKLVSLLLMQRLESLLFSEINQEIKRPNAGNAR